MSYMYNLLKQIPAALGLDGELGPFVTFGMLMDSQITAKQVSNTRAAESYITNTDSFIKVL